MVLALLVAAAPLHAAPGDTAAREARHLAARFPGRMAGTPQEDAAARHLADRLTAMGYRPRRERFATSYSFQPAKPAAPVTTSLVSTNIIAERPGTSGKAIIVGAHYDSRTPLGVAEIDRRVGGPDLEGLDDNASGVGVILELAERLARAKPTHSIRFILFGAEEIGLKGAHEIVRRMTPAEQRATLLMINIDSIVTGDRLYVHAGPKMALKSPAGPAARDRALAIAARLGITAATNPGRNPEYPRGTGCCSDQEAFDAGGISAINMEATNWDLGDKDGYQQTARRPAFPMGFSWHLADIDRGDHLEPALTPGRVDDRARDAVRILNQLLTEIAVTPAP
ncbi:aminopeptidase [Polymorphobacter fuscus]|nr:aminopeptidase [Polymorphobacter fuscus]